MAASFVRSGGDQGSYTAGSGTISLTSQDFGAAVTDGLLFVTATCRFRTGLTFTCDVNAVTGLSYLGSGLYNNGSDTSGIQTFYMVNPPSGTGQQIDINYSGTSDGGDVVITWEIWQDADQTTPIDNANGDADTGDGSANTTETLTINGATGDTFFVAYGSYNTSENITVDPTNWTENDADRNNTVGITLSTGSAAGAASVATTGTWNNSAITIHTSVVGCNVNAVVAGGPSTNVGPAGGVPVHQHVHHPARQVTVFL